jgi:hypothetical protein
MTKETDLGSRWLEAWRLRQEGKEILLKNGVRLTDELEAQVFEKADERLDDYFREIRRGDNLPKQKESLEPKTNEGNKTK